ncbi:class F sortase [Streptomyces avermitilis]|uniref:Lipoprotein n=2 Tax=Streptomyces avermitilis TaxID=33903 RepID=Q82RQ1_STRAW|nr:MULTISPECIES: class F sortase [Streptomyces]MYS95818.1 class F sortase [Streptomyces sp. SID5469]OOV24814.1 class F sortase [Streptomyces avermitilis]BAC67801.1 putative lipoprotein [Streptomyces avermitilis MA-4680 = NBRC 14893]BBJ47483.1 class F sortase [Streptomyces avermitilis]GDY68992.1 class F sortase [Streptomyces avermitilis]
MTLPSRRAFTAAAMASLLVGCAGPGAGQATTAARPGRTPSSSRAAAKPAHALGRSVPVGLQIPAIGVDTPLLRLGLAADGSVQVPPVTAHDRAGWYRHSPTPGQRGPSVILGHVTVGAYGDGVFRHLARLRRGERIVARLENGTAAVFAVTAVRTVPKADFPADAVYGDVNRPELRLITCGGPRNGDGYLDNVIVFAALSSASP